MSSGTPDLFCAVFSTLCSASAVPAALLEQHRTWWHKSRNISSRDACTGHTAKGLISLHTDTQNAQITPMVTFQL
eukprot:4895624-Amphidinium_carterae.1